MYVTFFALALLVVAPFVQAREPASPADLRAAYCLPHLNHLVAVLESQQGRTQSVDENLAKVKFRRDKVKNYLFARVEAWDKSGGESVLAATTAGRNASTLAFDYLDRCTAEAKRTVGPAPGEAVPLGVCLERMGYEELRLEQCKDVNFLPY